MFTLAPAEKRLTGAFPIRCDHARFDEMEKLTMPTNRIPKATHSRTMAQSIFVNVVAQLLLAFSQPMLAQSQQKPFASAGQNSQVLNETLRGRRDGGGKPTEKWSQGYSRACPIWQEQSSWTEEAR